MAAKKKSSRGGNGGRATPAQGSASKKGSVVGLKVDPELQKRWRAALAVVEDAKRRGMSAFDELWEEVGKIAEHDPPLYLAAGCATFKAFLEQYLGEDERTARRNMRIAKFASPDEEEKFGTSKIDAALSYLEAKTGSALEGRLPVAFDKLKIPANAGKAKSLVPFQDATVQQLAAATRALRSSAHGGAAKESPIVKAIRKALAKDGLRSISIHYAGGRITLGGIEPPVLAKLGKALASARLPEE